MESKYTARVVLAVIGLLLLLAVILPATRPPKARAQRISSVNRLDSVSLTLTNINAPQRTPPNSGR
jgi:hypothetical protein